MQNGHDIDELMSWLEKEIAQVTNYHVALAHYSVVYGSQEAEFFVQ